MKKLVLLILIAAMCFAGPAWALDAPIDEGLAAIADQESFVAKVPGTMMHGAYEIGEAPLEMLNQPFEETRKDPFLGLFKGINKGAYNLLEGMTRGIMNLLRAPVPGVGRYEKTNNQSHILPGVA